MTLPLSNANGPANDAPLVAAVQAGDVHAFDPLVERHLDAIHAFVALKLPVPHLVDELTHDTFVFAFRHIAEFTAGTSFRA
jgi:DNA-directed RNA polymerase specialized sigma24 family protein